MALIDADQAEMSTTELIGDAVKRMVGASESLAEAANNAHAARTEHSAADGVLAEARSTYEAAKRNYSDVLERLGLDAENAAEPQPSYPSRRSEHST